MWKETCVALLLLICVERSLSDYSEICGRPDPTLNPRIRGGQNATQGAWPWMVSLHKRRHICGGSLITKQWVLTAAHCVNGTKASDLTVYLGLWKQAELGTGVAYDVSSIHIYGDVYKRPHNDIALLKLTSSVNFTRTPNIKPMCLANESSSFPAGTSSWVIGWGCISATKTLPDSYPLQEVDVKVYSEDECKKKFSDFTEKMMCTGTATGGKAAGYADSGGPLMSKKGSAWVQSGVVKSGFDDCSGSSPTTRYTRVSEYKSWITSIITVDPPAFIHFS
ncbi:hypothetical protein DNTS_010157 [Danionella cerebrum]|uniref:Peptidase S1 domain-containing protein n=1 Tax=Danionella cerebrum TaxID=2873325 RepID=A0A553RHD0_9TELE|nr:hypothetical protein DNTS_010157 [Danionella translucida]